MKILFAGAGQFGLPSLKAICAAGHDLVQVISQPPRPAGRGRKLTPTPIAAFAEAQNLPLVCTDNINALPLPPADVLVVIAFGQKIAPHIVNHPRLGSFNLHSSRLPRHRGAAPINWAILSGDPTTGNSIIRLADKMDAGPILLQSETPIGELETAGELHDRLSEDGAHLVLQCLQQHQAGTVTETPQDHTLATVAAKLSRELSVLDFTANAAHLARRIRGLYPWPGCRVALVQGTDPIARLTLVRARALTASGTPGTILASGHVACGSGALEIIEVQPEGKRPMPLAAFRNGHPWEANMHLEAVA